MILAVDMGNTNIVIGCVDDEKIHFIERVSTDIKKTDLEYTVLLQTIFNLHEIKAADIEGAILSSVVPQLTNVILRAIDKACALPAIVVGAGIKTGLNIKIDNPGTMGADLVVGAVAAQAEYGAPVIIIDMGTATTVTVIDKDGAYIGGVILPGAGVSLSSLVENASQLPSISLEKPKKAIGTNTAGAMKSGIMHGQAGQIDGLIARFEEELGYPCTVVATGGLASTFIPNCTHKIIIDDDLLLKGLKILYDRNAS